MIIQACEWLGQAVGEGRFLIVRCLHDGGMSQIFLGDDTTTGKPVIVKVPKLEQAQFDVNFRQRFLREIYALKRLVHPNIVRILCHGEEKGTPFVVLRYLDGGTLGDRMYTGPEQTPEAHSMEELLRWLPTVAETLDFIHGRGYVHRDIKPHNILLDSEGKPFLGDLGIARVLAATSGEGGALTRLGDRPPGTPPYMAPEQICGQTGSAWSDQFALAVIVYEWLTGRRPFAGFTAEDVFDSQREPLMQMHFVRPGIPVSLSDVAARALSRRPADRFPTCQEFVSALVAAHESSKQQAPPANPVPRNLKADLTTVTLAECDLGVSVRDEEPMTAQINGTLSPSAIPMPNAAAQVNEDLPFHEDMYNKPRTLPDAPSAPDLLLPPIPSEPPVFTRPTAAARRRRIVGRVLSWLLVLLLLVAAFVGGRFLVPAGRDQSNETNAMLARVTEELDQVKRDAAAQREQAQRKLTAASNRATKAGERVEGLEKEKKDLSNEKAKIAREREELKNKAAAESRRAGAAEKERDRAAKAAKEVEERKNEAEKKAETVVAQSKVLKEKLSDIEVTMKDTRLWFVLRNATDSPVSYRLRWQMWDGDWQEGKDAVLAGKARKPLSAPPGSIRIEVVYNASRVAGMKDPHTKGINAQSFRALAAPRIADIDCKYTFEIARDRKELMLAWK